MLSSSSKNISPLTSGQFCLENRNRWWMWTPKDVLNGLKTNSHHFRCVVIILGRFFNAILQLNFVFWISFCVGKFQYNLRAIFYISLLLSFYLSNSSTLSLTVENRICVETIMIIFYFPQPPLTDWKGCSIGDGWGEMNLDCGLVVNMHYK